MDKVTEYKSWRIAIIFGIGYAVVGIAFPNPSTPGETQKIWRLAAWIMSAIIFGIHIWYEHFRINQRPWKTALHVAVAAALGAFGLAVAANIHLLHTVEANRGLLAVSLILWPVFVGMPAFLVAFVITFVLARIKQMNKP